MIWCVINGEGEGRLWIHRRREWILRQDPKLVPARLRPAQAQSFSPRKPRIGSKYYGPKIRPNRTVYLQFFESLWYTYIILNFPLKLNSQNLVLIAVHKKSCLIITNSKRHEMVRFNQFAVLINMSLGNKMVRINPVIRIVVNRVYIDV